MDLRKLDRDVLSAAAALSAARAGKGTLESVWQRHKPVATKTAYDGLAALEVSLHERALKDALLAWLAALAIARAATPAEAALRAACEEPSAHVVLERVTPISWNDAWRGLIASVDAGRARAHWDAITLLGPKIAPLEREVAAIEREATSRLAGAAELLGDAGDREASALAFAVLASTEGIARDRLAREERLRREAGEGSFPIALPTLLARAATGGWPARLSSRWLEELFAERTKGLTLSLPAMPLPVGGASFARALGHFGAAYRAAVAGPSALARPPRFVDRARYAYVFAALPASPAFQRRKLGQGAAAAVDACREMLAASLVSLRFECGAWLVATGALDHDEMGQRVFGQGLPKALVGAWPALRRDRSARLCGYTRSFALSDALRDRHDEDWFDNPRAWGDLRALALAHEAIEPELAARSIARGFEEALA